MTAAALPSAPPRPSRRRHWLSKTLAGAILGYALALAVVGILVWAGPGGVKAANKYQFAMWAVPPVWLAAAGLVFLFRSGLSAWIWLGGAALTAHAALYLCRLTLG